MGTNRKIEQWKIKMDEYRASVSKDQLLKDLKKSGYSITKKKK